MSPKNWVFIAICAIHSSHQATSEQGPSTTTKVHLYTFRKEEGRKGCLGNCNGEVAHSAAPKPAKICKKKKKFMKSFFSTQKKKSVKKVYFDETCTFLLPNWKLLFSSILKHCFDRHFLGGEINIKNSWPKC